MNGTSTSPAPGPTAASAETAATLRRLYFARGAFALVWAAAVLSTASHLGPLTAGLLVLYPSFDVAAAVVDARAARSRGATTRSLAGLHLNAVVSLLTAVAVGVATTSGIPAVLRVWGAWAIVAGLVQLVVAVPRRRLGGQWPLIVSGAVSTLAGASFIAGAGAADPVLTGVAGYAVPGAVFFLISALRLGRVARAQHLPA